MKIALLLAALLLSSLVFANPIDDKCPTLTYKSAPLVTADLFICHQEYAVAYSFTAKNPIYTTEFLAANHTGSVRRTNNFRVDPAVPKQFQASPNDYTNSGTTCNGDRCDKGHMTPSQDFSACEVCVSESFFMSNMVPQSANQNEQIWRIMEIMLRNYVAKNPSGIYVITGPIYNSNKPGTLGSSKIWVPDFLFKVAIDAKTGQSISFVLPNKPLNAADLSKYVSNLKTIENMAGIKFDSTLDIAKVANYADWQ
jgi:endonuclease G